MEREKREGNKLLSEKWEEDHKDALFDMKVIKRAVSGVSSGIGTKLKTLRNSDEELKSTKNSASTIKEIHDFDTQSSDAYSLAEENLRAEIKVFTDERFKEDAKTHHSKEFSDALKTLSSNKEFFLNLLKDLNSPLVKHIQSIDDACLEKEQRS
ncbi:hypothetical protein LguiA_016995 [Lonicera macranthoides]